MQTAKVGCMQCPEYGVCPQTTRLFVNYCGSRKERVRTQIRSAIVDCHARRAIIIKQVVLPPALMHRRVAIAA